MRLLETNSIGRNSNHELLAFGNDSSGFDLQFRNYRDIIWFGPGKALRISENWHSPFILLLENPALRLTPGPDPFLSYVSQKFLIMHSLILVRFPEVPVPFCVEMFH